MPKPNHRLDRVNARIRDLLAEKLPQHFRLDRFGLITVLSVKTVPKFDSARVSISVLKNSHTFFGEELPKKLPAIQAELNKELKDMRVPRLIFDRDESAGFIEQIDELAK